MTVAEALNLVIPAKAGIHAVALPIRQDVYRAIPRTKAGMTGSSPNAVRLARRRYILSYSAAMP